MKHLANIIVLPSGGTSESALVCQESTKLQFLRGMMRYAVYKQTHRENVRWYARPLMESELKDNCIVFEGENVVLLACQKARELNEKEGRSALAA